MQHKEDKLSLADLICMYVVTNKLAGWMGFVIVIIKFVYARQN